MKRLLWVLALAGPLLACSREKTYSDNSMQGTSAAEPRAEVARPSDLNAEQVRLVQRALSDKGFSTELNGTWDARTQSSLMSFQRSVNLAPTGNVNAQTAEALGLDPQQVMPVRGQMHDESTSPQAQPGEATPRGSQPAGSQNPGAPEVPAPAGDYHEK